MLKASRKSLKLIKIIVIILIVYAKETNATFWIASDLTSIEWKRLCLTTAGCGEPRFRIIQYHSISNTQSVMSWSIGDGQIQEKSRPFTSNWEQGSPEEIMMSAEVGGIDPTYNFPRTCDSSDKLRLFQQSNRDKLIYQSRLSREVVISDETDKKMVVELKGRCFNATLTVQKFLDHCPWCIKPSELAIIENQYPEESRTLGFVFSDDRWLYIAIIVSAFISLTSCIAFACLLKAYLRQKQLILSRKSRFVGIPHDFAIIESPCSSENSSNSRYEIPWDKKYRFLPRWTSIMGDECKAIQNICSSSTYLKSSSVSRKPLGNLFNGRPEDSGIGSASGSV